MAGDHDESVLIQGLRVIIKKEEFSGCLVIRQFEVPGPAWLQNPNIEIS